MSGISQCPECDQKITLPRSTHPQTQVQCPLCDAKYLLEAALNLAPPTLIVLEEFETVGVLDAERESSFDSAWGEGNGSAATQDITRPVPAHDGDDYELLGGDADIEDADTEDRFVVDTDEFADSDLVEDEEPEFEPFGDVAVAVGESSDDVPSFGGAADVPTMAPLSKRKKSKGGNFLIRQIVGVFGGGAIGLSVGYMIILWLKGPSGDFLKVGGKLPSFMVPAAFSASVDPSSSVKPTSIEEELAKRPEFAAMGKVTPPASEEQSDEPAENGADEPKTPTLSEAVDAAQSESKGGDLDIENIADLVGPTNLKGHTGAEVSSALKSAANVKDKLKVAGDWKKEQGGAYVKFCQLAEALLSIKDPDEPGLQLQSRRTAARNILQELSADQHIVEEMTKTSQMWCQRLPRTHQGVLLAGKIDSIVEEGAFYAVGVQVNDDMITVITQQKPSWNEGQNVVLLGAIVDEPQFNLGGYTGDASTVVWTDAALGTAN